MERGQGCETKLTLPKLKLHKNFLKFQTVIITLNKGRGACSARVLAFGKDF